MRSLPTIEPVTIAAQLITRVATQARMNQSARLTRCEYFRARASLRDTRLIIAARTPGLSHSQIAQLQTLLIGEGLTLARAVPVGAGETALTITGTTPLTMAQVNRELGVA